VTWLELVEVVELPHGAHRAVDQQLRVEPVGPPAPGLGQAVTPALDTHEDVRGLGCGGVLIFHWEDYRQSTGFSPPPNG